MNQKKLPKEFTNKGWGLQRQNELSLKAARVPGAVATKPPPSVIFCQVGVSHIYVTESKPQYQLGSVIFAVAAATFLKYA